MSTHQLIKVGNANQAFCLLGGLRHNTQLESVGITIV